MSNIATEIYRAATHDLSLLKERVQRSFRSEPSDNPNEGWTHETVYEFTDGERVRLEGRSVDSLIFPASPGYEQLLLVKPKDADPETFDIASRVRRMPIIGWELRLGSGEAWMVPLTPDYDGNEYGDECRAVLMPDGRVQWGFESWNGDRYGRYAEIHDSFDAWVTAVRADWQRILRERAEHEAAKRPCEHCGRAPADAYDDVIPF